MKLSLLLTASAVALATPAFAQTDDTLEIYPTATVKPHDIVVTATRAEQRRWDVGQAVTVLDRTDIAMRQFPVVSDLLATTPGITVSRNGGPGQPTAVRIRGAEDAQTLVVIDGVRVNDPTAPGGAFDFGNLLTNTVERIEVLRGPNSVPWGSQAIGGVVNIVTARPTQDLSTRASAEYGYKNQANLSAQLAGASGAFEIAGGGGYYRDDGVSAFKDGRERDGYRQFAGNLAGKIGFSDAVSLDLRGYYANSKVGFDGFPPPAFAFADTDDHSKTEQSVGYAGLNAELGGVKNRLAFTLNDINRDSFGDNPFTARGRVERYEYQGDTEFGAVRLVFGAEHERPSYFDGTDHFRTRSTSGYVEAIGRPVDALTLTGGVRVDDYRTYGARVTGAANAAFRAGQTTLRVAYGEGFKAPTLYQLFSAFGNPGLDPERARSLDFGVEQGFASGRAGVTLFGRNTRDQIDFFSCFGSTAPLCATRPFGYFANIARTRARGVESFVELRPLTGLTVNANYTYIDAENRTTGERLLRRPKHSANLAIDWHDDRLSLGGSVQAVSASRDFDFVTFAPTRLSGYALAALRGSVKLGDRLELFARVENLFDERYETVSGYGTLGRNAHGGVRVRL